MMIIVYCRHPLCSVCIHYHFCWIRSKGERERKKGKNSSIDKIPTKSGNEAVDQRKINKKSLVIKWDELFVDTLLYYFAWRVFYYLLYWMILTDRHYEMFQYLYSQSHPCASWVIGFIFDLELCNDICLPWNFQDESMAQRIQHHGIHTVCTMTYTQHSVTNPKKRERKVTWREKNMFDKMMLVVYTTSTA